MKHSSKKYFNIYTMVKIALCITLLCICSYIIIPLPFSPVVLSMHTVAVNLIALLLTPFQSAITLAVYLLMGFIGLPIFAGGTAGPGKLLGPTGGFYWGFLLSVIFISLCKGKRNHILRYCFATIGFGIPIQHLFAMLFFSLYNGFHLLPAFISVSLPFILTDIIKCIIASSIAVGLNYAFQHTT